MKQTVSKIDIRYIEGGKIMISIIKQKFIRFDNGKSVVLAEICVDTAEELPNADGITGRLLVQGSLAWDISTGDFYGLNSSGEWINQTGGDE